MVRSTFAAYKVTLDTVLFRLFVPEFYDGSGGGRCPHFERIIPKQVEVYSKKEVAADCTANVSRACYHSFLDTGWILVAVVLRSDSSKSVYSWRTTD